MLSTPLFRPGAEQGPGEALAPGHGQTAPWPYGALVAVRTRFFRFQAARTVEAEVALAIAISLKRETHRPSYSVAQRATGAMRNHLAEAEVALAIAVSLKKTQ